MADIEILGVDVDGIGQPRNDGTRGSALYRVPIKLSAQPSAIWSEIALETWDHPPSFTTMHRPGIASVVGDRFVLDGTTVEEVEAHHAETLKLVVDKANQLSQEVEEQERAEQRRAEEEAKAHVENVAEVSKRIKF